MGRKQESSTERTLCQYKLDPNEQDPFCTLPLRIFHCDSPFTSRKENKEGHHLSGFPNEMTSDSQQRLKKINNQKDCKYVVRRCSKPHQTPESFNQSMIQDYTGTRPEKFLEKVDTTL